MLFALVFGGLAAAIAAPVLMSSDADTDDGLSDPDLGSDRSGGGSLLDMATLPEFEFDLGWDEGDYTLPDFDPVADTCDIDISDLDTDFEMGWREETGAFFTAVSNDETLTVSFPGLDEVPMDAVRVTVDDPDGDGTLTLTLTEIFARGSQSSPEIKTLLLDGGDAHPADFFDEPFGDFGGLVPISPEPGDAVDTGTGPVDDIAPLLPEPGDQIDVPDGGGTVGTPLQPVAGDVRDV